MPANVSQGSFAHQQMVKNGTRRFSWSIVLLFCGGLAVSYAERPADGRLAWDQSAPTLATAQSYEYHLVIDGGRPRLLTDVKCAGVATPFSCRAGLPDLAQGAHNLVMTATALAAKPLTSAVSAPLATVTLNGVTLACSPSVTSVGGTALASSGSIGRDVKE